MPYKQRFLTIFVTLLFCSSFITSHLALQRASGETAEEPKVRTTQVTAGVHDTEPPSTPVLIAPTNNKKLTINTPTFVWTGSTDNFEVTHYRMELNGTTKFDEIPLTATTNDDYVLTYDSGDNEYSLTVKTGLGDGSYTWNIVAVDIQDNEASSVIWNFSIDTKAPSFVITLVEDQEVEISAGDSDSVPSDPIELEENEPEISGTGEANSTVQLTVKLSDSDSDEYNFTIGGDGKWSVTLDTLPRDTIIYLNFVITDPSGNVSILSDVPLRLKTETVVIEVPIPIPVTISPLPSLIPSEVPTPVPTQLTIILPKVPPKELIPPKISKTVVFYVKSTEATARKVSYFVYDNIWGAVILALLLTLPTLKITLLAYQHRHYLSWGLFSQILWVIGILDQKKPQGIIISQATGMGIGFSLVLISGKTLTGKPLKRTLLSNADGIFPMLELPEGTYRLSVQHPNYLFPTLAKPPAHLEWNTYYTGRDFKVEKETITPPFVLVAEPTKNNQNNSTQSLRDDFLRLPSLSLALGVLATVITVRFPNLWNVSLMIFYYLAYFRKLFLSHRNNLSVKIITTQKEPLPNTTVILKNKEQTQIEKIVQTGSEGVVGLHLKTGKHQLQAINLEYHLAEGDQKTATSLDTSTGKEFLGLIMTR